MKNGLKKCLNGAYIVLVCILNCIELYLLAAVITNAILGTIVLTVSIFSTVPVILSAHYWILFLIVSIPIGAILVIAVIVKMHKDYKNLKRNEQKPESKEATKENK